MVNDDKEPENDGRDEDEWIEETRYSARLGGIIYRNVQKSIVVNGEVPVHFSRNTRTRQLGVSFRLQTDGGVPIANVRHNRILNLDDGYVCLQGAWGASVIDKSTGRVWCDLRTSPIDEDCELDCSCILLTAGGYPILLHPNRTILGRTHENNPPNIAGATLIGDLENDQTALNLTGAGFYIIGLAIVDFRTGIKVSYQLDENAN